MPSRRGLVAPQNTFLEKLVRRSNSQHSYFALANARVVDYPVVHCNDGFCKLTGYSRAEVMQKGSVLTFMWGELTNRDTMKRLEESLEKQVQDQFEVVLYKKNKTDKVSMTTSGAKAETLKTSAMALCYSVAEYCASVWCRPAHTSMIDSQLNSTMRN